MINEVINAWELAKPNVRAWLKVNHPKTEEELVKRMFFEMKQVGLKVDVDAIVKIDNRHTWSLIFIVPLTDHFNTEGKYNNWSFYLISLSYGSHPASDMLLYIQQKKTKKPNKQQVKDYMLMALHIIQNTCAPKELKNIFWDKI